MRARAAQVSTLEPPRTPPAAPGRPAPAEWARNHRHRRRTCTCRGARRPDRPRGARRHLRGLGGRQAAGRRRCPQGGPRLRRPGVADPAGRGLAGAAGAAVGAAAGDQWPGRRGRRGAGPRAAGGLHPGHRHQPAARQPRRLPLLRGNVHQAAVVVVGRPQRRADGAGGCDARRGRLSGLAVAGRGGRLRRAHEYRDVARDRGRAARGSGGRARRALPDGAPAARTRAAAHRRAGGRRRRRPPRSRARVRSVAGAGPRRRRRGRSRRRARRRHRPRARQPLRLRRALVRGLRRAGRRPE